MTVGPTAAAALPSDVANASNRCVGASKAIPIPAEAQLAQGGSSSGAPEVAHGEDLLLAADPDAASRADRLVPGWAPCQERALRQLLGLVRARAPLIELRSPPGSRGHGVTSVLRALAAALGESVQLLGISATLGEEWPERTIFDAAQAALRAGGGVVIVDDLDLAVRPDKVRASRNAGEHLRGAGAYAFEDPPEPARLLKALRDEAEATRGVVVFSTVEEMHARYMQAPSVVKLVAPSSADVAATLSVLAPQADAAAVAVALPAAPSFAELRSARATAAAANWVPEHLARDGASVTADICAALRANLPQEAAVSSEEVEQVDLASMPGMDKIAARLETHVLYPLLQPEEARRRGLAPKRGVLLHGPPGTGKTSVGRALAHRLQGRFFMIRELLLHKEIMEVFAQARAAAPSVVFFDDIDVLLGGYNGLVEGARGHDLTRFLLSQMDGLCTTEDSNVVVVMTAAEAKFLPPAILRSGRIELWLKTEPPKAREREAILRRYVDNAQAVEDSRAAELAGPLPREGRCGLSAAAAPGALLREPLNMDDIARTSEGFVAADLKRIVCDARNAAAADGARKAGGEYLREAASDLRSMKEEVEGVLSRMYT